MFNNIYGGRKVFITGHTGFKGSWLALWLLSLGAKVAGYALHPHTHPNHYDLLGLDMESLLDDVRTSVNVFRAIGEFQPDVVFHLAAQPLVFRSYGDPSETFETNVIGTVNVLEACRKTGSVKAIIVVTSDKCYENDGRGPAYKETDRLGGDDPYSASKGCAELVTASYMRSFFSPESYLKSHQTLVASVRAGNVMGGGDWGKDRLVPDIMGAAARRQKAIVRHPDAVRPWQHVLDPLCGYLLLGQRLIEGQKAFSGAWNFGPEKRGHKKVLEVVKALCSHWSRIQYQVAADRENYPEARVLRLDSSKARTLLQWKPLWNGSKTFEQTARWYREFYESGRLVSRDQIAEYVNNAGQKQRDRL